MLKYILLVLGQTCLSKQYFPLVQGQTCLSKQYGSSSDAAEASYDQDLYSLPLIQ